MDDFIAAIVPPDSKGRELHILVGDGRVVFNNEHRGLLGPFHFAPDDIDHSFYLGQNGEDHIYVSRLVRPQAFEADLCNLYSLLNQLPENQFSVFGRATQIVQWYEQHQFCGRCGTPTDLVPKERALSCPSCGLTNFPKLSPCIITLVTRGDEVLLARGPQFPPGMFSTLAGFIEPGESAEQALRREVEEEVGVRVGPLHYFGSQPWPFPHQLMLGYFAEYAGGDIVVDGEEILEAAWWSVDALPKTPPPSSISGQLIQAYVRSRRG
jgi:NAD+ diphosphatase